MYANPKHLLFALIFLLGATTTHGQQAAPHIVFDTMTYNLGNIVSQKNMQNKRIPFRNISNETLYIWRGYSQDGGFWVCGFDKIVPPHSTAELTYCYNTAGRRGPFFKTISLEYRLDPKKQEFLESPAIIFKGNILEPPPVPLPSPTEISQQNRSK